MLQVELFWEEFHNAKKEMAERDEQLRRTDGNSDKL